jgi:hypothetical protein
VSAFRDREALELYDGFKRLRAARGLGLRELRAVLVDVDIIEATRANVSACVRTRQPAFDGLRIRNRVVRIHLRDTRWR